MCWLFFVGIGRQQQSTHPCWLSWRSRRSYACACVGIVCRDVVRQPSSTLPRDVGIVVLEAESALLVENGTTRALKLCEQAMGVCLKQWALLPSTFLAPCHEALLTIAQVRAVVSLWCESCPANSACISPSATSLCPYSPPPPTPPPILRHTTCVRACPLFPCCVVPLLHSLTPLPATGGGSRVSALAHRVPWHRCCCCGQLGREAHDCPVA